MKSERIKQKIKALLAKTEENGASEFEAIAAMQKAQQLMPEYYIDMKDIAELELTEQIIKETIPIIKTGYNDKLFLAALSDLFDVFHVYNKREIYFIGFENDAKLAAFFYLQIMKASKAEKAKFMNSEKFKELKRVYHGRTLTNSFMKGFYISIVNKMREMYNNRNATMPEAMSLMVINKKEKAEEAGKAMFEQLRIVNTKVGRAEASAFNNGVERGKEFDINQGIETHRRESTLAIG